MPSKKLFRHTRNSQYLFQDAAEFRRLYENRHLDLFRFIYGLHGGSIEDVEDLTTMTFLRAWKSRHNFQGDRDAAFGWLLKIARNLVIDEYRRHRRRGANLSLENQVIISGEQPPEDQVSHTEQIRMLETLVAGLPDRQKEIIVLRYILDWRVKEIASHLHMKENTVSATIHRTLKKIQAEWPHT